jgi:hypothetical protein
MIPNWVCITYSDYYEFYRYSEKEANKICKLLNKNTKYCFELTTYRQFYKTVPPRDFITLDLFEEREEVLESYVCPECGKTHTFNLLLKIEYDKWKLNQSSSI